MEAIKMNSVVKKYDDKFQLGPLNLTLPSGVIIGLIGENGAGKTTLIKTILNIVGIDEGDIKIFNKDHQLYEKVIKEDIGVVLDDMFLPEILTVNDINSIMKHIYKTWDQNLFYEYLNRFDIPFKQQIKKLSKGMRKKLEIVTALSHHPKLLILDEPTSGLDPVVRNDILDLFLHFISDEEHTILLSTHITSDLENIADRIVFIEHGNIILNDTRDNIMDNYGLLKCGAEIFNKIEPEDILTYKQNKYDYTILISDISKIKKKYTNCVIDKISLDDLMLLMIKGEKSC